MRFRNSHGFTLIELIVALAIMMMIMTVAFAGFRIGLNAWERGTKAANRLDQRSVVERLIRRQLPLAASQTVFQGSAERIEFVSDYSLEDGAGDFRKIDYAADNGRFMYGDKPLMEYDPKKPDEPPQAALAQLKQVSFEFLGADNQQRPAWIKEWKNEDGVPAAVRIRLDDDMFIVPMVNRK